MRTVPVEIRERCPDCQTRIGEPHCGEGRAVACDIARCTATGMQRVQHEDCDCDPDIWTGLWPGVMECEEFGWYSYFVPNGRPSWRPCTSDHPGAAHDLNRLATHARWDPVAKRWWKNYDFAGIAN